MKVDSRVHRYLLSQPDPEKATKQWASLWGMSKELRHLLARILEEQLDGCIKADESKERLKLPNYAEAFADSAGERRGLRSAIDLLTKE